jgi:hypothetical protein
MFLWTSVAFELLIPLILTTILFWVLVMPKGEKQIDSIAKKITTGLRINPCNSLLQMSLQNLGVLRDNMRANNVNKKNVVKDYVIAINLLCIVIVAAIAVAVPVLVGNTIADTMYIIVEILLIYAIVVGGEIYFIKNVAFKYVPHSPDYLFNQVLAKFAYDCFDKAVDPKGLCHA